MLQYIIDAYEQKNNEEGFFKSIKNMRLFNRVSLYLIIGEFIVSFLFIILRKLNCYLYLIVAIGITTLIHIYVSTRIRRKYWHENMEEYNLKLKLLKDILDDETVNYYSKNKIKILMSQCDQSINEIVAAKEKSKAENKNFLEKIIIPIVTFAVGSLSNELKSQELLILCVLAIIIIILLNFGIKGFAYVLEDAEGNLVEERQYMRNKLQDLLVRDFETEVE